MVICVRFVCCLSDSVVWVPILLFDLFIVMSLSSVCILIYNAFLVCKSYLILLLCCAHFLGVLFHCYYSLCLNVSIRLCVSMIFV